jgi:hypothetical protein
MYRKLFEIKTHRNEGFSPPENIVIFRIDFNKGLTWILCNGKIDEKAKHLYTRTGVKNVENSPWQKIETHRNNDVTTHHSRYYTNDMTHLRRTGTIVGPKKCYLLNIHLSNQRRDYS